MKLAMSATATPMKSHIAAVAAGAQRLQKASKEGAAGADITRMAERSKAVKADNKAIVAGYNAVIAELREEVARLKEGAK